MKNLICGILIVVSFYFALGQEMNFFPLYCLGMIAAYLLWR